MTDERSPELGRRGIDQPHAQGGTHDLGVQPFAVASADDWRDPEETLKILFRHAEARAIDAIRWYLEDRKPKKRASRMLRALAIIFAALGTLIPVAAIATNRSDISDWGYVFLGVAAALIGFDRIFGLSTAWMRDMRTAQSLQERLELLQYTWALESVPRGTETDPSSRLLLLREFAVDVSRLIRDETAEWAVEFVTNLSRLEANVGSDRVRQNRSSPSEKEG
jgi:hypothetical protein